MSSLSSTEQCAGCTEDNSAPSIESEREGGLSLISVGKQGCNTFGVLDNYNQVGRPIHADVIRYI